MNKAWRYITFRKRLNLWASLPGRKTNTIVVGKWFADRSRMLAHEWTENTSCRILQPRKAKNESPYCIHTVNENLSDFDEVTVSGVVSVGKAYHFRRCAATSLRTLLSNARCHR